MPSRKMTAIQALFFFLAITSEAITASTTPGNNPWVARMLQTRPARSGKQEKEQYSGFFFRGMAGRGGRRVDDGSERYSREHCVDVSTYGLISFNDVSTTVCDTIFEKKCEDKSAQVCLDVTEMNCHVEPYTDCKMSYEEVPYRSYDMVKKEYNTLTCTESTEVVQQTKTAPECKNVTRQNCVTKWKFDSNGKKVWAGNEDCEDVTWEECKLVARTVDFTVPKVDCLEDGKVIPYMSVVDTKKTQTISKMLCDVKSVQSCMPMASTVCETVEYQECAEVPVERCFERDFSEPSQEKLHKEKCILINGSTNPTKDGDDTTARDAHYPYHLNDREEEGSAGHYNNNSNDREDDEDHDHDDHDHDDHDHDDHDHDDDDEDDHDDDDDNEDDD